ncbi:MAG: ribosome small subunit-dependent GTPase A [Reichenbachiella sp.]
MTPQELGFSPELEAFRLDNNLEEHLTGRVVSVHRERYGVKVGHDEYESELIGNLRFTIESHADFPAVGDWVAISPYDDRKALIHAIYPRSSMIERQAVGQYGQTQVIATNIDCGLIVQAADRDFNMNRIDRYLTICNASEIEVAIVLSKIDLISEEESKVLHESLKERFTDIHIFLISNESMQGLTELESIILPGKTYCLLGSSGVGKSTLLNYLKGDQLMKTAPINTEINRGKHTTTHRELVVLKGGGILIDNPGMREVGIGDTGEGLAMTFEQVSELSQDCRFKDCSHEIEEGCAVLEALDAGELDHAAYTNFQKLKREQAHFQMDVHEKRKKGKSLSKMIRSHQKAKRKK